MFYAIRYKMTANNTYERYNLRMGGYKNKEFAIKAIKKSCNKHDYGEVIEYGKKMPVYFHTI